MAEHPCNVCAFPHCVELHSLIAKARIRAYATGTMSALWDLIFDAEAILEGKSTAVKWESTEEFLNYFKQVLDR